MAVTSDSFQEGFSAAEVSGGTNPFPYLRSTFTIQARAHTHIQKEQPVFVVRMCTRPWKEPTSLNKLIVSLVF